MQDVKLLAYRAQRKPAMRFRTVLQDNSMPKLNTASSFTRVGVMAREEATHTKASLFELCLVLNDLAVEIAIDRKLKGMMKDYAGDQTVIHFCERDQLSKSCDLLIVIGGDGSLLAAARAVAGTSVPVLGINRGRLGFLTDIAPADIAQRVREVLLGDFIEETRFLLGAAIRRSPQPAMEDNVNIPADASDYGRVTLALNDIVLHPYEHVSMIEFELFINDEFVYQQRSDGLIIATPTGSTAYALSCGGAIMHPSLNALSLVPINAHTLSSRPITVHGSSIIRLKPCSTNRKVPYLTADGQKPYELPPGCEIVIEKSASFRLIHPRGYNFYETCRSKLGWAGYAYE